MSYLRFAQHKLLFQSAILVNSHITVSEVF